MVQSSLYPFLKPAFSIGLISTFSKRISWPLGFDVMVRSAFSLRGGYRVAAQLTRSSATSTNQSAAFPLLAVARVTRSRNAIFIFYFFPEKKKQCLTLALRCCLNIDFSLSTQEGKRDFSTSRDSAPRGTAPPRSQSATPPDCIEHVLFQINRKP